ncbi:MAG: hypothetical protein ABSA52_08400 [Candidatus Binatia bacterium]|jgi:hypothetical protein
MTTDSAMCAAGDTNHDGAITIDEILGAVNAALNGCGHPTSNARARSSTT